MASILVPLLFISIIFFVGFYKSQKAKHGATSANDGGGAYIDNDCYSDFNSSDTDSDCGSDGGDCGGD